jgi:hypothetical protein
MKSCIAILCREPQLTWLYFLNTFKNYDIFFIIDDNQLEYNNMYKGIFPNINFIQFDDKMCENAGFKHSMTAFDDKNTFKKTVALDKALYYFSTFNNNYDNIWFIEEDVFFYNENTILNIDNKYTISDLLIKSNSGKINDDGKDGINIDGKRNDWHWSRITPYIYDIEPPFYSTTACAVRISKNLLNIINKYITKHKSMFHMEAFFLTVAKYNKLKVDFPEELLTIIASKKWNFDELNQDNLFHPIKNVLDHVNLRRIL